MVTTAGILSLTVSRPPSTSRVTATLPSLDRDLGGEGALRPAEQRRQHLAGLIAVVVDRLLAEDDELGLLRSTIAFRILATASGSTVASAVSTRMPRSAPMASAVRMVSCAFAGPTETTTISVAAALLLDAHRLFDGDLVEGVHRHLDVGELDARSVRLDADLDVVIDDPLDRHQYLHAVRSPASESLLYSLCCLCPE